jgi:MATE family multidrug resistance protein
VTSPPIRVEPSPLRAEVRALALLATPLAMTHVGHQLLGLVDVAVVGRLGERPLAATGLGNNVFFTVGVLGFGWMLALDPMIAQALGAGERGKARAVLVQGGWVALAGSIPLSIAILVLAHNLERFGIDAGTAAEARAYLHARLPGLLPFLGMAAARSFLQGHESTRPLVVGVVAANVVNLPLDYLLVFGDPGLRALGLPAFGVPAMGVAGAGAASAIATTVQLVIALVAVRGLWGTEHPVLRRPEPTAIFKTLRLGTPIGLTLLAEVGSFSIVTFLMGNLGTRALSSHNVALVIVSTTFQVALALGAAGAVRVGHAIGREDVPGTRRAGLVAIAGGALAMVVGALVFLTMPRLVARALTSEVAVVDAVVPLLSVAAAFQVFDGVQTVASGVLRGAGDTRAPLLINLAGHYLVGIPIGVALAFGAGWGAVGLWWGLSAGLTAVAVLLTLRFSRLTRRPVRRV